MDREKARRTRKRIDEAVKAVFEAKAAEPVPQHLVELAHDLDAPQEKSKAG